MRWLKRDMWKAGITIAGMLLLLVLIVWVPVSAVEAHESASGLTTPVTETVQVTPTANSTIATETANEQLRKLQRDNDRSWNAWFWNSGAALISSLVLALAGILAIFRYFSDRSAERDRRKEEQDRWLKNQEAEREKRAEERFQTVVAGLGSEREEAKVGAAIMLRTFLQKGYEQFYSQTFDLAVAYLRLPRTPLPSEDPDNPLPLTTLRKALIVVFKEAFPLARDELLKEQGTQFHPQSLDATGVQLDGAYLVGADLQWVWMHQASLREADLSSADLREADLRDANLSGANLNEANLSGANLGGANLSGANLREADLREADLSRVRNLEDVRSLDHTDLRGVKGLAQDQLKACKARGAIIDEDSTTSPPQSPVSPPPSQSSDIQAPSAPPAQVNTPPPETDGSSAASSKPDLES